MLERNRIHQGDSAKKLNELEPNSVQLVVTSPPYFAYSVIAKLMFEHPDE